MIIAQAVDRKMICTNDASRQGWNYTIQCSLPVTYAKQQETPLSPEGKDGHGCGAYCEGDKRRLLQPWNRTHQLVVEKINCYQIYQGHVYQYARRKRPKQTFHDQGIWVAIIVARDGEDDHAQHYAHRSCGGEHETHVCCCPKIESGLSWHGHPKTPSSCNPNRPKDRYTVELDTVSTDQTKLRADKQMDSGGQNICCSLIRVRAIIPSNFCISRDDIITMISHHRGMQISRYQ